MLKRITSSSFVRKAATLSQGTIIGQAIFMAASPLLTRLYTPDDFAVLGVLMAFLGVTSIVACLRYELSLPLAKDAEQFQQSLLLGIIVCHGLTLLLAIILGLGGDDILFPLGLASLQGYQWLMVGGFWAMGLYVLLNLAMTCQEHIRIVSRTKVSQALLAVGIQISTGLASLGVMGLLVGYIVGQASGLIAFMRALRPNLNAAWQAASLASLWHSATKHRRFALLSTPAALINRVSVHAPLPLLASLYGTSVAGLFLLGQKLLALPLVAIGRAVAQIFMAEFGKKRHKQQADLPSFFVKIALGLFVTCLPLMAVLYSGAPYAFALIFGENWGDAGVYVQRLIPMFILQFVAAPLAQTLNLAEQHGMQFIWDSGRLVLVFSALYLSHSLGYNDVQAITCYSVAMTVFYITNLLFMYWRLRVLARTEAS